MPRPDPLPQAVFHWRRALIALWLSATAHMAILAFIRVSPAAAPHPTGALQVRLEPPAKARLSPPLPTPTPSLNPPAIAPQPELQPSAQTTAPPQAPEPEREPEPEQSSIPHLNLPELADTTYYDAIALDVQPRAVSTVDLVDPEAGSPNPHVGHVKLQLKLEADGRVSDIKVLESSLPSVYEALALDAFGKAKFTPGRRNGRAVRARVVIEVKFKPPQLDSR